MIHIGSKDPENLHLGNKQLERVMLGNKVVWENNKIILLGNGKSWNIKNLYPNLYNKLTVDNFFILSADSVTGSDSVHVAYEGDTQYIHIRGGLNKDYTPSTGALNMYLFNNGNSSNLRAVMVSKPEKLVYCGYGQSFDIKRLFPTKYQTMNENNFVIKTVVHWNGDGRPAGLICNNSRSYPGSWSGSNTEKLVKSYSPSTGVLSCYLNDSGDCDNIDTWNRSSNVYVYASEKAFA